MRLCRVEGFATYKSEYYLLRFTMIMKTTLKPDRRVQVLFHTLGLSCIGGAIFLQVLVFTDILQHGYFMAVEKNPAILTLEVFLTIFSLVYFVYTYFRFIRSIR